MEWKFPQILIAQPQSTALHPQFQCSILYSPSSYLKSPLLNLNSPSSTLLPQSLAKSTRSLTKIVLKRARFPTKCPQAPLAPLAAFSRSAPRAKKPTNLWFADYLVTYSEPLWMVPALWGWWPTFFGWTSPSPRCEDISQRVFTY